MDKHFIFHIDENIFSEEYFSPNHVDNTKIQLISIFEVARQLKAEVYYPLKAVKNMQEEIELFEEYYTQSTANLLDVLLEDFITITENNYFFKVHFADENTSLEYQNINLSKTVNDKNFKHILLSLTENNINTKLLCVESNTQYSPIETHSFAYAEDLWAFINKLLPKRKYNFSKKHGNRNYSAIPHRPGEKVSQLRCTDEEAQILLDTAIFDWRERKWCYNFDTTSDTYIIFPCEGDIPQNQFHAFHIEKSEWGSMIPKSILKYFKKGI